MKYINSGVTAAKGFKASGVHCGIRKNTQKNDLSLIYSEKKCSAAAECLITRSRHRASSTT